MSQCSQPPKVREKHETDFPSEPPEGTNPANPAKTQFPTSDIQNLKRINFCSFKTSILCYLFWQPYGTNTDFVTEKLDAVAKNT